MYLKAHISSIIWFIGKKDNKIETNKYFFRNTTFIGEQFKNSTGLRLCN